MLPRAMGMVLAALVAIVACGCHQQARSGAAAINVWTGKSSETCLDLAPGDTLVYRFDANATVAFNIHYHQGDEIVYPLPEQPAVRRSGELEAGVSTEYCLMWTNPSPGVAKIDYEYRVR